MYYFDRWDDPVACFFTWLDDNRVINSHYVAVSRWRPWRTSNPRCTVPLTVKMMYPVKPSKKTGSTKRRVKY